jgi:hypothetical protein
VRVLRKKVLFSILFLLIFILLPIIPIATAGSKPTGQANVELSGDVESGEEILDVRRAGRTVIVHSDFREPVNLKFKADALKEKYGENHIGKFGFHIDKRTEQALIILRFDAYTLEDLEEYGMSDRFEGWPKYQLEKYGEWEGTSIPIGKIDASGDFTVYRMHYTSNGKKKSAAGVEHVWDWSGTLTFEIIIR